MASEEATTAPVFHDWKAKLELEWEVFSTYSEDLKEYNSVTKQPNECFAEYGLRRAIEWQKANKLTTLHCPQGRIIEWMCQSARRYLALFNDAYVDGGADVMQYLADIAFRVAFQMFFFTAPVYALQANTVHFRHSVPLDKFTWKDVLRYLDGEYCRFWGKISSDEAIGYSYSQIGRFKNGHIIVNGVYETPCLNFLLRESKRSREEEQAPAIA
jgi:hypothetical protein